MSGGVSNLVEPGEQSQVVLHQLNLSGGSCDNVVTRLGSEIAIAAT
jgi:hypothetical protein